MPSKSELAGVKKRVIVLELEDNKWLGAGDNLSNQVIKELNATNNVVIVDRTLAAKLGQEIQLAEIKGRTGYRGQDVADFAVSGKITDAATGVKFTEASSWQDKEGKSHHTPAKCTTSGRAAFSLKIVQLPSLDVIKTIDQEATASSTQDARWMNSCPQLSKDEANGIVSAAVANALRKANADLKNQFAPSGFILERRTHEENNIFKTTLGTSGGAKEGLPAEIIRVVSEQNALTGVASIEQIKIAEGLISDQLGAGFSYLIVSDEEKADKILLGDKVQVKYENSFLGNFGN